MSFFVGSYMQFFPTSNIYITLYFNVSSTLLRKNQNTDFLYIYIYIYICCVKKRSHSKCFWRIQLVFIFKLFSLYKCFLAYFSISKIKQALPYVTDAFIVPNFKNESAAVFMALQVVLCVAKIQTNKQVYVRLQASVSFCLISHRMNIFLRCNVDMTLLHAATWISTQHESPDRNLAQRNTGNCLTIAVFDYC